MISWLLYSLVNSISVDCQAVLDFASTSGMRTTRPGTYISLSTGDCCNQNGVTCGNGRVTYLYWVGFNLNGTMNSTALNLLSELTGIEIQINSLKGSPPFQFPPKVTRINVGSNLLTGQFGSIPPGLAYLHFDSDKIGGVIPTMPDTIDNLSFNGNPISGTVYARSPSVLIVYNSKISRLFVDDILKLNIGAGYDSPGYCNAQNTNLYTTQVAYLSGVCQISGILVNTECGVVQQIARDLNMNTVDSLTYQTLTGSCCGGHGVTCDGNNHVIAINWSDMNLNGTLDTQQIELLYSYLQYFNVSNNKINGTFSNQFTTNLLSLDLSANKMSGNVGNVRFNKMQVLNINSNQFTGHLLAVPPLLSSLQLAINNFTGVFPSNPQNLNILDISYNSFSGILSLYNISIVNIQHNTITDVKFNITSSLTFCNLLENRIVGNNYPQICSLNLPTTVKQIATLNLKSANLFTSNSILSSINSRTEMIPFMSTSTIMSSKASENLISSTGGAETTNFLPIFSNITFEYFVINFIHGLVNFLFVFQIFRYLKSRGLKKRKKMKSEFTEYSIS